jgi:hypothetical protein
VLFVSCKDTTKRSLSVNNTEKVEDISYSEGSPDKTSETNGNPAQPQPTSAETETPKAPKEFTIILNKSFTILKKL